MVLEVKGYKEVDCQRHQAFGGWYRLTLCAMSWMSGLMTEVVVGHEQHKPPIYIGEVLAQVR